MSFEKNPQRSGDQNLRSLERAWKESGGVEEGAKYYVARIRAGEITEVDVERLALLGDKSARLISSVDIPEDYQAWALELMDRIPGSIERIAILTLQEAQASIKNMSHEEDREAILSIVSHLSYAIAQNAFDTMSNWMSIDESIYTRSDHWWDEEEVEFTCDTLKEFVSLIDAIQYLIRNPNNVKEAQYYRHMQVLSGGLLLSKVIEFDVDEEEFIKKVQENLLPFIQEKGDPVFERIRAQEVPDHFIAHPLNNE
jgi:hypothetical protein